MGLATLTLYKTLVMVILAIVGIVAYKVKIVDAQTNKKLSELVLSLFTPVLLFMSFQKEVS
ncbi:MAG: hypothetical protein HUJ78_04500, partial [Mogibacterium sp.]|nr:hypothetical protein [Mogibacterium sp.]